MTCRKASLGGKGLKIAVLLWCAKQANEIRCAAMELCFRSHAALWCLNVHIACPHENQNQMPKVHRLFPWEGLSVPIITCLMETRGNGWSTQLAVKTERFLRAPWKAGLCWQDTDVCPGVHVQTSDVKSPRTGWRSWCDLPQA